eukprot:GHRR01034321.1.p1 GENE.GHRR01034321.1~~GHRR01034321.1.p1  ORF type:complete len:287 (-),score=69.88 GHRR01034321.1:257-1117(-)
MCTPRCHHRCVHSCFCCCASALCRVLYAPLGFFLQNPVGEMLVAFSKDQDILDENLVDTIHYLGIYGLIMLSTVITVSVTIPMFSVFAGVLILVTLIMLSFYLPAATALKKQKVETAGALVGLVAETLEGLPIITAFNQNNYFVATAASKIDEHHRALFNGESLNLWLAFYCDLYGAVLVFAVCIFAVVMRVELGPAAVGLAFSNTIQVRKLLLYIVLLKLCSTGWEHYIPQAVAAAPSNQAIANQMAVKTADGSWHHCLPVQSTPQQSSKVFQHSPSHVMVAKFW